MSQAKKSFPFWFHLVAIAIVVSVIVVPANIIAALDQDAWSRLSVPIILGTFVVLAVVLPLLILVFFYRSIFPEKDQD